MTAPAPFQIHATDAQLEDLRARLHNTRWPEREVVDDWSQGTPLSYVQEVSTYWADQYDWRSREAALNRLTQWRGRRRALASILSICAHRMKTPCLFCSVTVGPVQ
ncbi:epoxide hydrolase N-terminal domain-containing protein [Sulfitobacter sediminilitoris]|uniref:epoxide hydrolase N-terminal domain-containing protein n=1 Tax=Sulfitobacter sediminilitoris TaxID=2698830 RepID=UPI003618FC27